MSTPSKQQHPRIPSSTYRLQFNREFTFKQAREIVPYLDALGISDCYASPYFQARAESFRQFFQAQAPCQPAIDYGSN